MLIIITAAFYGADIWADYFRKVGAQQAWVLDDAGGDLGPALN